MTEQLAAPSHDLSTTLDAWRRIQAHLVARVIDLAPDQLRLKGSMDGRPIWAIFGHVAYGRVYWLCGIAREPGAEDTPFADPFGFAWEDDLEVERTGPELVSALETTGRLVDALPQRWTSEMLDEVLTRQSRNGVRSDTRRSALTMVLMHDAYHSGELALILGSHGLRSIDPWTQL